jgi:hypothetical protein
MKLAINAYFYAWGEEPAELKRNFMYLLSSSHVVEGLRAP